MSNDIIRPKVTIERLTPEDATKMLDMNLDNRRVKPPQVESLHRSMAKGIWRFNGDSIRIDWNGVILDGQHRLLALEKFGEDSDMSLQFLIVRDLDPKVFSTIDIGSRRSSADTLMRAQSISGNYTQYGAMIAGLLTHGGARKITPPEVEQYLKHHEAAVIEAFNLSKHAAEKLGTKKVINVAAYLINEVNHDAAVEFFDKLATGANLPEGSPILALRNRLATGDRDFTRHMNNVRAARAAVNVIVRTYNAWRAGRSRHTIQYVVGDGTCVPITND